MPGPIDVARVMRRRISVVISYGESTQFIDMVVVPDNLDDDEEEDDDDDDKIHRSLAAVSSALDPSRCNDIHTRSNTYPSSRYNESTAAMDDEEEEEKEEEKQSVVAGESTSSNGTPPSDPHHQHQ